MYDQPKNRGTWDSHDTLAYYIDIAEKHYRNYRCYIPDTNATRISGDETLKNQHPINKTRAMKRPALVGSRSISQ